MYIKILILCLSINLIHAYVITESAPAINDFESQANNGDEYERAVQPNEDAVNKWYKKEAAKEAKLSPNGVNVGLKTESQPPTFGFIPSLGPKVDRFGDQDTGPKVDRFGDQAPVVLKSDSGPNNVFSPSVKGQSLFEGQKFSSFGAQKKGSAEDFGKFQAIPYYVTKSNDLISDIGDIDMEDTPTGGSSQSGLSNLGSLDNLDALSKMPGMESLGAMSANGLGAIKSNFTMHSYMKYLTRNSTLTPADMYKYVFSKKCSNSYNMVCLKLDLIKILTNINNDKNKSISIIPHLMSIYINNNNNTSRDQIMSMDQEAVGDESGSYAAVLADQQNREFIKNKHLYEQMVLKNNYNTNYYIDNILKKKIIGLLNNMSLNIKLFDNTTVAIIKKLVYGFDSQNGGGGSNIGGVDEKEVFDGRGTTR